MRHKRPKAESGFTLIEVLVSLVLLAVLSLILMNTFHFSGTVLDRVGTRQADVMVVSDMQTALRRWLSVAYPEYVPSETPGLPGRIIFDGRPDGVTFLSPAPTSLEAGGMALMRLTVVTRDSSTSLLVSAKPELAWRDGIQPVQETLLTGVTSVRFAYWGTTQPGATASWHSTWSGQGLLPRLVRISVTFGPGDRRSWPELLISPAIRADSTCQFTPLQVSCLGR